MEQLKKYNTSLKLKTIEIENNIKSQIQKQNQEKRDLLEKCSQLNLYLEDLNGKKKESVDKMNEILNKIGEISMECGILSSEISAVKECVEEEHKRVFSLQDKVILKLEELLSIM